MLSSFGLDADAVLVVKDLGPQFSYRGVFLIEYGGPIAIILACAMRPALLFGGGARTLDIVSGLARAGAHAPEGSPQWSVFVQALAITLWIAHFVKREVETCVVHKFSRATMPLANLFRNSAYYWGFAAAVAYPLCHPAFTAPSRAHVVVGVSLWLASQLVNLAVHLQLAGMREGGRGSSSERKPPTGPLFALVSCPNYLAEALGWVGWSLVTHIAAAYIFTLVGALQMLSWALDKHRHYLAAAPEYKRLGRKAMVPFVV